MRKGINTSQSWTPVWVIGGIAAMFAVLQVIVLNQDSTSGEQLTQILTQTQKVEEEIEMLEADVASASALFTIVTRAQAMGLVEKQNIVSLISPLPIAYSNNLSQSR